MELNLPPEITWDAKVRQKIKDAILAEAGRVRICQKVFPTRSLVNHPTEIPFDVLAFDGPGAPAIRIPEGETRKFVELSLEFPLTVQQTINEPEKHYCLTLARMAAKAVALAEDMIIFQGQQGTLPANVTATNTDNREPAVHGLLGAASPNDADDNNPNRVGKRIDVPLAHNSRHGVLWGENTFTAVADGIAKLVTKAQAPEYALFLPIKVYADTFALRGIKAWSQRRTELNRWSSLDLTEPGCCRRTGGCWPHWVASRPSSTSVGSPNSSTIAKTARVFLPCRRAGSVRAARPESPRPFKICTATGR